jgi:hypothetical protein
MMRVGRRQPRMEGGAEEVTAINVQVVFLNIKKQHTCVLWLYVESPTPRASAFLNVRFLASWIFGDVSLIHNFLASLGKLLFVCWIYLRNPATRTRDVRRILRGSASFWCDLLLFRHC